VDVLAILYASEIFSLETPISRIIFSATAVDGDRGKVAEAKPLTGEFSRANLPDIRLLIARTLFREKASFVMALSTLTKHLELHAAMLRRER
jgi:hypothetical protein